MWSQGIKDLYKHSGFFFPERIMRKLIIQVLLPANPVTHRVLLLLCYKYFFHLLILAHEAPLIDHFPP